VWRRAGDLVPFPLAHRQLIARHEALLDGELLEHAEPVEVVAAAVVLLASRLRRRAASSVTRRRRPR
jgi:hypothetical protein